MNALERTKGQAIKFALSMAKRPHFASGGVVGPLLGTDGGRTDTLPISVPAGAYVLPADVVSGIPGAQGNSLAGHKLLGSMFSKFPLVPDSAPYGAAAPGLKAKSTMPKGLGAARASGGAAKHDEAPSEPIDIMAAGGEYVVPPEVVKAIGHGDMKRGHEILDDFVLAVRNRNIKDLKKLPGPVKHD